jgi:hypothetical protein
MVALATVCACGGRVAVDASGGESGSGGVGGTGVADMPACHAWCEVVTQRCDYKGSCVDDCLEQASYLAPCQAEFEALMLCDIAGPPVEACFAIPDACDAAADALWACVYPTVPCESTTVCKAGSNDEPSMTCTTVCGGVVYMSACGLERSGFPMDCICQIDGETVGTCQNVTGNGSARLGCCAMHFAESG